MTGELSAMSEREPCARSSVDQQLTSDYPADALWRAKVTFSPADTDETETLVSFTPVC